MLRLHYGPTSTLSLR